MKQIIVIFILFSLAVSLSAQNIWLNELHYDNYSTDVGEFLEIVLENAGSYTLNDFTITLYNGNAGAIYDSKTLDQFTTGITSDTFTLYYYEFPENGIQNGAPDGIAIDYQGTLIPGQFLSYEGTFEAGDGPAVGVMSTDIGVEEGGDTQIGESLQLAGDGSNYADFFWQPPAAETPGNLNNGQTIGGAPQPTIIVSSPNGGEQWEQGSTHDINWISINFTDNVKIELEQVYERTREILVASTENDGSWEWNIPIDQLISDWYVIIISDAIDGDPMDQSDDPFSIIEPIPITSYTIYEIQYSTTGPSPHVGELVETSGVVTAIFDLYFFIQDGDGAWNGIVIYPMQTVAIGDEIVISGLVDEYFDKTEITDIINMTILGSADLPAPVIISTSDLASSEDYEGVLVQVQNVTVTNEDLGYGEWEIDDGSGPCVVGDLGDYTYVPVLNDFIYSITGVSDYTYEAFKLEPRDDVDILMLPPPDPASNPNPENGAINVSIEADLNWINGANTNLIDLYFGNFNPPPLILENNTPIETYDPGTLDYEETYYWKVVCKNDVGSSTAELWNFITEIEIIPPEPAANPNPEDGAINVSINTDLSWTNGNNTELIDFYFGNVDPPPLILENNTPIETYDPGTLDYEETYYWKVVCKNVAGSSTADIWDFTTEIENIPPPDPATNPDPENGAIDVSVEVDLNWTNGTNTNLIDLYFGNVDPPPLVLENNAPIETYDPGILDYEETYYWKVVCKNAGGSSTADLWNFTTEIIPPPDPATNPDPENGAIDVSVEVDLNWTNGTNTNLIDLYFGNVDPPPLVLENNAPIETYDPGILDYEETYYWKVVCKNDGGSSTADIWSFTTEIETSADDMIPSITTLIGNFPNPFNPETTICYQLSKSSPVELSIYNLKGQLIKTLVKEFKEKGQHSIIWNAEECSSGIYFYHLQTSENNLMKKMLLMK